MTNAVTDLVRDMNRFRANLAEMEQKTGQSHEEMMGRLQVIKNTVEELKETTWELDPSTNDNLVFYGIKEDDGSGNIVCAVKEVCKDKTATHHTMENIAGYQLLTAPVA